MVTFARPVRDLWPYAPAGNEPSIVSMTATLPGTRCATVLFGVGLPFAAVVRTLVVELDFTDEEATRAALGARSQPAA